MMDVNMEDVGRVPSPTQLPKVTEAASIPTLDGWIENLMTCKQLPEQDVQRLCEKVRSAASPKNARDRRGREIRDIG